jgi:hypothetical protein
MNAIIESKRKELVGLCLKYHVRRLKIFGSAVTECFDPNTSDLDFVVQFKNLDAGQYADTYFGLLEEMEKLFQRRVDLIMDSAIDNPYFREKIEKTGVILFAA